jgi:hypothetical protein
MDNRQKLNEKIRKKKEARSGANMDPFNGETDISKMMENVNKILKTNPQMVKQISKCVTSIMKNSDLMESLTNQLSKENLNDLEKELQTDQTLETKSPQEDLDDSPNESIQ